MDYEKEYKKLKAGISNAYLYAQTDSTKAVLENILPELVESEDEKMYARVTGRYTRFEKYYLRALGETEANKVLKQCEEEELWIKNLLEKQKDFDKMIVVSPEVWDKAIADAYENGKKDNEKQKEQKPNIELIQQSWYMEGYHDREFGKEPKWILKISEGGPKHELNPKYGEYIKKEQKPDMLQNAFDKSKKLSLEEKSKASDYAESILPTSIMYGESEEEYKLHTIIEAAFIAGQKEQKPTWSEEDERMLNQLIYDVEYQKKENLISAKQNKATEALYNGIEKCYDEKIAWLKSLPLNLKKENEDVAKLCSNEWSEENRQCFDEAIEALESLGFDGEASNLKSLRDYRKPLNTWKPSEEQMKALNEIVNILAASPFLHQNDYLFNILNGLREELKKLL